MISIKGRIIFFKGKPLLLRWEKREEEYFSMHFGEQKDVVEWALEEVHREGEYSYGIIAVKPSSNLPRRTPVLASREFKATFVIGQPVLEVIETTPTGFEDVSIVHASPGTTVLLRNVKFTLYNASKYHVLVLLYKAKGLKPLLGLPPVILKENSVEYNPNALIGKVSYSALRENLYKSVLEELRDAEPRA